MTKKKTKKQEEEYNLQFEQQTLKTKKNVYDTYLKALVKYNMPSTAYASIMFCELYDKSLLNFMERNEDNPKAFQTMFFGAPLEKKPTEIEFIQNEIKYYDKLINLAEHKIDSLPYGIKMKIAKDSIRKKHAWLGIPEMEQSVEKQTKVKVKPKKTKKKGK